MLGIILVDLINSHCDSSQNVPQILYMDAVVFPQLDFKQTQRKYAAKRLKISDFSIIRMHENNEDRTHLAQNIGINFFGHDDYVKARDSVSDDRIAGER